jgi:hypothetical protein
MYMDFLLSNDELHAFNQGAYTDAKTNATKRLTYPLTLIADCGISDALNYKACTVCVFI